MHHPMHINNWLSFFVFCLYFHRVCIVGFLLFGFWFWLGLFFIIEIKHSGSYMKWQWPIRLKTLLCWWTSKESRSTIFEQNTYRKWPKNRTQQDLLRLSFTCKYCQVHKLQRMHPLHFQMLGLKRREQGKNSPYLFQKHHLMILFKSILYRVKFSPRNIIERTYFWCICPILHHLPQICFRHKKA